MIRRLNHISHALVSAILLLWMPCIAHAQSAEAPGEADVSLLGYYFGSTSQPLEDSTGVAIAYRQFLSGIGELSVTVQNYGSHSGFQSGENVLQLKGVSTLGRHWDFSGGDLRIQTRRIENPFSNIFMPEITARGFEIDSSGSGKAFSIFGGLETLQQGPRLPYRVRAPQNVLGATFQQQFDKFQVGVRFARFTSTDAGSSELTFAIPQAQYQSVNTLTGQLLYNFTEHLKFYGETTFSGSRAPTTATPLGSPVSTVIGPVWESSRFSIRANYVYLTSAYFPMVGYFGGDRKGPYVEGHYRPTDRIDLFASANQYANNLDGSQSVDTFNSYGWSGGVSLQLPRQFSANAQLSLLNLTTRSASDHSNTSSNNRFLNLSVSRPFRRHNLRLALLDLQLDSDAQRQHQRSLEFEDAMSWRVISFAGAVRFQNDHSTESKNSIFFRGSVQANYRRVSAYANVEKGNDLVSKSVFTTNSFSSTSVGASIPLIHGWSLQADAFRNQLITTLNPESIFLLGNQGIGVPTQLNGLNQWSVYFRINKHFQWGTPVSGDLEGYTLRNNPLVGVVEGFVFEQQLEGAHPAVGIPVTVDDGRSTLTDSNGHYRIVDVPEGRHLVQLSKRELPADFEPAERGSQQVTVTPRSISRIELSVRRLTQITGRVIVPPDVPPENVIIRLSPSDRYTTPDTDGSFSFYNLREGDYEVVVDTNTVPEGTVLASNSSVSVKARVGTQLDHVEFEIKLKTIEKPVMKILETKIALPQTSKVRSPKLGRKNK